MGSDRATLLREAMRARQNAAAPISGFTVGAAIETASGNIFTGCNIENITLGLTVCAERVALWKALSEGEREFKQVAVVTDAETPAPPCGACRQLLWEYCGDIPVQLHTVDGKSESLRLSDLLPHPFDRRYLSIGKSD